MAFLKFEHKKKPLLSRQDFLWRTLRYSLYALVLVIFSVGIGTLGYHFYGELDWIDAFFNACMILAGVGPIAPMPDDAAKIFSSFYALFSGTAFFSIIAVLLSPVVHRFLHMLNQEDGEEED